MIIDTQTFRKISKNTNLSQKWLEVERSGCKFGIPCIVNDGKVSKKLQKNVYCTQGEMDQIRSTNKS